MTTDGSGAPQDIQDTSNGVVNEHDTLKYHLLGPSLTKAGQDSVDQQKVSNFLAILCPCELTFEIGLRNNIQCFQRL